MDLRSFLKNNILIFDGAMGTMLQNRGLKLGQLPEILNIENQNLIIDIHKAYIEAGCNIITTNTFGANSIKMREEKYSSRTIAEKAIENAKIARKEKPCYIAYDMGPLGELIEPMGTLTFHEAYEIFKEQVEVAVKCEVDCILIETMTDLYEAKAAILAAKENSTLPVFCTMSFERDGRTFTGCSPVIMTTVLQGLGVEAVGINCSLGPKDIYPLIKEVLKYSKIPVMVQPNLGLPKVIDGRTKFDISLDEFVEYGKRFVDEGIRIVGGCCGTTDMHIKALREALDGRSFSPVESTINKSIICSATKSVEINGVKVIGERINPTGKTLFKESLMEGNMDYILKEAIAQVEAGADILDVNVGLPGIDEADIMERAVREIQSIIDVPLQIDSNKPSVIEKALRAYNGKAIVNSVNGDEDSMNSIFPLVKKYGAAVIGLTLDHKGLPETVEDRIEIAKRILKKASEYGVPKEDVYIDCLTLTAAAQQKDVMDTVKALSIIKEELKVNTVLGISNVSFGLPNRGLLNRTFLSGCLMNGLTLPIINPLDEEIMDTIRAYKALAMEDIESKEYVNHYSNLSKKHSVEKFDSPPLKAEERLFKIITTGLRGEAKKAAIDILKTKAPLKVVDEDIIPALDYVGDKYEKGEIFLPQLIQCAETVKEAFDIIKEQLSKVGSENISNGTIVLATVKGDIHDIGKNIVKTLLENYGFKVIDLGKNVPYEGVTEAVLKTEAPLVGLSALMTTTVKSMEETIRLLKKAAPNCKIMVGGAVLTEDYAMAIGADFYAKDAKESVRIAKNLFNNI